MEHTIPFDLQIDLRSVSYDDHVPNLIPTLESVCCIVCFMLHVLYMS